MYNKADNGDIKLEPIGSGRKIFVSSEHTFGTDAILLASFANAKKSDRAADLGTGCGIIPFLWARNNIPSYCAGIDISENAIFLADKTCEENGFLFTPEFYVADIKSPYDVLKKSSLSLVTCNPPYKAAGTGIISSNASDITARHETQCTLEDIIKTSSSLLTFGGRLAMCHRPERLGEIFSLMINYEIQPKALRLVCKTSNDAPWLVLVSGRRGGGKGLKIEPCLIMYNDDGTVTDEVKKIYGEYGQNRL